MKEKMGKVEKHLGTRKRKSRYVLCSIKLARFWRQVRYKSTLNLVRCMVDANMDVNHFKTIGFSETVEILRRKPVIAMAKKFCERIHRLSVILHGISRSENMAKSVNVRVILVSYLILSHPSQVFESMGPLEIALEEKAGKLQMIFDVIIHGFMEGKRYHELPLDITRELPQTIEDFQACFKVWKEPDEEKLKMRIRHALVGVLEAYEKIPSTSSMESIRLQRDICKQLAYLRMKFKRIAGNEALEAFDREYPYAANLCDDTANVGENYAGDVSISSRMTNEEIVHELLLNPNFRLTADAAAGCRTKLSQCVRKVFQKAFFASLVSDLELCPPCYFRVFRVLNEVRSGIAELANTTEARVINEIVDMDLIKQQISVGIFNWECCIGLIEGIVGVIKRVQSPARDAETSEGWSRIEPLMKNALDGERPTQFCNGLEFVLDRLNAIRVDGANQRILGMLPVVIGHGVDFERGSMRAKLESGVCTLDKTINWMTKSLERLSEDGGAEVVALIAGRNGGALIQGHANAMMDLLDWEDMDLPEILELDAFHLEELRGEFKKLVGWAVTIVTVRQFIGEAGALEVTATLLDETNLGSEIEELDWKVRCTNVSTQVVGQHMEVLRFSTLLEKRMGNMSDPVHTVMKQRMHSVWVKVVGGALCNRIVSGLRGAEGLYAKACECAGRLKTVVCHNRRVHGPIYERLMPHVATDLRE